MALSSPLEFYTVVVASGATVGGYVAIIQNAQMSNG